MQDMELYRRSDIFEHILASYSPSLRSKGQRKQTLELVHRAIQVGGGMTLVTRVGILSWLAVSHTADKDEEKMMEAVSTQLHQSIDTAAIQSWRASQGKRTNSSARETGN
jgi:nucleolar pre-ribosomal-associated protein 1